MLLEPLLLSEDRELRLRTLKTLGSLGYITSPDLIIDFWNGFAEEKYWNSSQAAAEKIMLARLMGNIKHASFLPYLEELIMDRGYAVRNESAKAIRKYRDGKLRLRKIADTHADVYARNIANEWLERSVVFV
jgi:HEAT repeat protein